MTNAPAELLGVFEAGALQRKKAKIQRAPVRTGRSDSTLRSQRGGQAEGTGRVGTAQVAGDADEEIPLHGKDGRKPSRFIADPVLL